jgi:hypothetical protein
MERPPSVAEDIENMVGALCDPIIVWPGYENSLPDNIRGDITMHRLIQNLKGEKGVATWPEVCAYMMTASLDHPFPRDWVEIYEWAFAQYVGRDKIPEGGLRYLREELDTQQQQDLMRLRVWIWNRARGETRRRLKDIKKEKREEAKLQVVGAREQQLDFF